MPLFKSKEEKERVKEEKRIAKEEKRKQKQMMKLEKARKKERATLAKKGLLPPQTTGAAAVGPGGVPTTPMGAISSGGSTLPAAAAGTAIAAGAAGSAAPPAPPLPPPTTTTTEKPISTLKQEEKLVEEKEWMAPATSSLTALPTNAPPGWTAEQWELTREELELERRQLVDIQRVERDRLQRLHELELAELLKQEHEYEASLQRPSGFSSTPTTWREYGPTGTLGSTFAGKELRKSHRLSMRDQLRSWRHELASGQTIVDDDGKEYVILDEKPPGWNDDLISKNYSRARPLSTSLSGSRAGGGAFGSSDAMGASSGQSANLQGSF